MSSRLIWNERHANISLRQTLAPIPDFSARTPRTLMGSTARSADFFYLHGSPVRQNFRDSLHHFIGVVAHRQDAVGSVLRRML